MSPMKTSDLLKLLSKYGFTFNRQSGSHMIYKNAAGISVCIVDCRMQAPGTIRNILKTAGVI